MSEIQTFAFPCSIYPEGANSKHRISGVELIPNDVAKKNVFFLNQETGKRTHEVLLDISANCSSCTELRRGRSDEHHCSPLRFDGKLAGSYDSVFLSGIDRNNAVCPLYLAGVNPPFVNVAYRMLTIPKEVGERTLRGLDILEQFPNAE